MIKLKKFITIFIIIELFFIILNCSFCIAFPDHWNNVDENYNIEQSINTKQYESSYYSRASKECALLFLIIIFTITMLSLHLKNCKKHNLKPRKLFFFIGIPLIILLSILIFLTLNPNTFSH